MFIYIEILHGKIVAIYKRKDGNLIPDARYKGRVRLITSYQYTVLSQAQFKLENIPADIAMKNEISVMIDMIELDSGTN